uniref:T-complex protein 1 subunit gamma n=1 Tax=Panstrongylus lignarius TaxID=156445 RepID=A0A224XHT7_9HEMI
MFGPVLVLSQNTKRDSGRKVHFEIISATKAIAEVIRTCLGPQAMLKMLMDPMGGIVMTNDGNAILREITVQHPAAKTMIEIARTQDEEVGDGTTSVIILAGEMLAEVEKFVDSLHPTVLIRAFRSSLDDILDTLPTLSKEIDMNDRDKVIQVVQGCLGTKFLGTWSDMACKMAIDACSMVRDVEKGFQNIDLKNFARIEKVPGGLIEDSQVLEGILLNKDVTHPKMKRYIENPVILLLDCPLEYKKGESQTNVEIMKEGDFTKLLQIEEEYIENMCKKITELKPNLVFTEKGVSDLAQHFLVKAGITCIRRIRKTDNNRLARAVGATIMSRVDEIKPHHLGTEAGLFEIKKIGDEYFLFITKCKNPKACTVLLRGSSKDILNEVERNMRDALNVVRNLYLDPRIVPGGGAVEMMLKKALLDKHPQINVDDDPLASVPMALKIIPRTIIQNSGAKVIRVTSELEERIAKGEKLGVDGVSGEIKDIETLGIWEPLKVKTQVYKTAVESAMLLLKIDDIVSGAKSKDKQVQKKAPVAEPTEESMKE